MARQDASAACRLAIDQIAREMRCTSRPRLLACRGATAFHAKEDGDFVDVYLDECHLHVAQARGG